MAHSSWLIAHSKHYTTFDNLPGKEVICAVSSRSLGNMSLNYGPTQNSSENRRLFLDSLGIDYKDLVCAQQVHAAGIKYTGKNDLGRGALSFDTSVPATDAFITDGLNVPLAIFTADCLSVFLYDIQTPAIGLVHAGWRSSKENITFKTIELMQRQFNTNKDNLFVAFGPAIRACCCQVEKEFQDYFPGSVSKRGGYYYLDLAGANRKQVLEAGLKEANIVDCGICTSCRGEEFYSYRREDKSAGRMMSVMMLK